MSRGKAIGLLYAQDLYGDAVSIRDGSDAKRNSIMESQKCLKPPF
jgi:hypothetical protein